MIELESLIGSPFAKEKADLVILGTPDSSGIDVEERKAAIAEEHEFCQYRLVPVATLEAAQDIIKSLSENHKRLLEEVAPLIQEAAKKPGNRWYDAARAWAQATDQDDRRR